jgi:hypothetical protein
MGWAVMLRDFFHSGRAADLVLLFMAIEFVVLSRRRAMVDVLFAIAPGACLILALRAALTGSNWIWIAAPLAVSLPFHLADLARRRF